MSTDRLPKGFAVRLDSRVRITDRSARGQGGANLVAPFGTVVALTAHESGMIDDGVLEVTDHVSGALARRLLDLGVAHPRPSRGPSRAELTVVIPVRDGAASLDRLLGALTGVSIIVVDDGSYPPIERPGITVIRHQQPFGLAEARNTGLRAAQTPFVAFLDPCVQPGSLWAEALLAHFADPDVGLVVPRLNPLPSRRRWAQRYDAMRPSLEPGRRECGLSPGAAPFGVPASALVARRKALLAVGGFDAGFPAANGTDVCLRLVNDGWRVRFDPVAVVQSEAPSDLAQWVKARAVAGSASARLSASFSDASRLALWSRVWPALLAVFVLLGKRSTALGLFVLALGGSARLARRVPPVDNTLQTAATMAALELRGAFWRCSALVLRHAWPVSLAAAVVSRRARYALAVLALAEGAFDWMSRRDSDDSLDLVRYAVLRRVDDMAFGFGAWQGYLEVRKLRQR
ncbi:mycofactocin biosynthesis glycosyltransferase MftF [Hoyosella sp. YIM 151337]|uniref:mycofactocin biosynthesis glycosyltransferase MftF n=1 Tax=Hoyosella sp. YIM 151337 TaxID=2992742 RepID=UPI0022361614|nr:mycofactocin biosynthesis glycosyltransferase MftF [Hoyosella sp. YIM 151337]MCW4356063.1 mycofactocin biosynthesis glycosyltransferase MftF [Hoyosella sp. YIM 151337]